MRPLLFFDGEHFQLGAIFEWLTTLGFDAVKSAASCSPFQQSLDRKKFFMNIHQHYSSKAFSNLLRVNDKELRKNRLMTKVDTILSRSTMKAGSKRVFVRFFSPLEHLVAKTFTETSIDSAWVAIGVRPFNLQRMLESCPAYNELGGKQKLEVAEGMPALLDRCAPAGFATDDDIHDELGRVIGRPKRSGIALQELSFNRWRSAFFTPETIKQAKEKKKEKKEEKKRQVEEKKRRKKPRKKRRRGRLRGKKRRKKPRKKRRRGRLRGKKRRQKLRKKRRRGRWRRKKRRKKLRKKRRRGSWRRKKKKSPSKVCSLNSSTQR